MVIDKLERLLDGREEWGIDGELPFRLAGNPRLVVGVGQDLASGKAVGGARSKQKVCTATDDGGLPGRCVARPRVTSACSAASSQMRMPGDSMTTRTKLARAISSRDCGETSAIGATSKVEATSVM